MTAPRRPETARPRQDSPESHEHGLPTDEELDAIELQHATRMVQSGAEVTADEELGVWWIRFERRTPQLAFAMRLRWPEAEAETRLARLTAVMQGRGEWPSLSISEGLTQPTTIGDTLADAGWRIVAGERLMFTRHPPTNPHLDPTLRIVAVTPATAKECVELEITNFGLPLSEVEPRTEWLAEAVRNGSERAYIVRSMHKPVASARLIPGAGGAACLSAINVVAAQRGRGYGRLVTSVATRAGLATGAKLVWLSVDESNAPAVKLYESLGFEPTFAWSRWIASA
ncbi:MAG TPA: GNAT family N-acetyltransferase [Candidatus Limnocylindrales bacterium]|nr:GNAT family N-acetyltransferase [Candidatus Limnocylindrales bacterium]